MNERDELQAARRRIREREAALADVHMEYYLERTFLDIACERLGMSPEELKEEGYNAWRKAKEKGDSMKAPVTVGRLCCKLGMSRQNYYQVRR